MLLLYINISILYFYNIWSLVMSSHGYSGNFSSFDVVQGGSLLVCKGGDSCRCWSLEGVNITAAISLSTQIYLEREAWCRMHSSQCKSPKAGHWSEERTFYYKCLMSPLVSSVDYYRLAQIWGRISCLV